MDLSPEAQRVVQADPELAATLTKLPKGDQTVRYVDDSLLVFAISRFGGRVLVLGALRKGPTGWTITAQ